MRRPRLRRAERACACASLCVPDEESEEVDDRSTDALVRRRLQRRLRDHRRADRPAHRRPGQGRAGDAPRGAAARSAHGSTPWLGDNAVLKAIDVFRQIESLPFARESSELFDRPSINLGRIVGGDALQQGARPLRDRRRHPLPARPGPAATILAAGRGDAGRRRSCGRFTREPAIVVAHEPVRARAARARVARTLDGEAAERRPRRRLRRDLVPRGGRPGGRVRPARRRPPRPRRVGVDRLAASATARRSSTSCTTCPVAGRRPRRRRAARAAGLQAIEGVAREHADGSRPPRARGGMFMRFLIGSAIVVALTAVADRDRGAARGRQSSSTRSTRAPTIKGSISSVDHRATTRASRRRSCCSAPTSASRTPATGDRPRSDTMMLIRLDPDEQATTVLSIPRDLKVDIPGARHRQDQRRRTTVGGPQLALKTVKELLDSASRQDQPRHQRQLPRLPAAVNALGCVYVDVDRRYYTQPRPAATGYARSTSSPATSGCAARTRSTTCATATRTPTSCAPPASRTSCARPRSQVGAERHPRRPRQARDASSASYTQTDRPARLATRCCSLLKLVAFSASTRSARSTSRRSSRWTRRTRSSA